MAMNVRASLFRTIVIVAGCTAFFSPAARASRGADSTHSGGGPAWRFQLLVQRFVAPQMHYAYGSTLGLQGSARVWGGPSKRMSLRVDGAFFARRGQARIIDPNWTVTQRRLSAAALDLSISAVVLVKKPDAGRWLIPYVGGGVGDIVGLDQLRFAMSRAGMEHEEHTPIAFRTAFEGHVFAGAMIPFLDSSSLVIEAQWVQAGKAIFEPLGSRSAEQRAEDDLAHAVLAYPDLNLTGPRLLLGAQLGW
jgi:hypothetical protein